MDNRPKILFLDAYDSFSNNITPLLATRLHADVHVLPIDAPLTPAAFRDELQHYDAVVCGPGPGSPHCAADIGLMQYVWEAAKTPDDADETPVNKIHTAVPTLGICLGFQSLVAAHGGHIRRLRAGGLHGMVRVIDVAPAADIFAGVPAPFRATLYHSLGADVGQDRIPAAVWSTARWDTTVLSPRCADLLPLAWVEEPVAVAATGRPLAASPPHTTTGDTERILMAVRHRTLPFWGLQYHPESVCTDEASHTVLDNWFRAALQWNADHRQTHAAALGKPNGSRAAGATGIMAAHQATRPRLLSLRPLVLEDAHECDRSARSPGGSNGANGVNGTLGNSNGASTLLPRLRASSRGFVSRTLKLPEHVHVPDLVEALAPPGSLDPLSGSRDELEHIVLDSATAAARAATTTTTTGGLEGEAGGVDEEAIRGRFSIVALDVGAALRIEYRTGDRFATLRLPPGSAGGAEPTVERIPLRGTQTIWQLLAEFHDARRLPESTTSAAASSPVSPFLGGFMGYITYEQGLGDIGVDIPAPGQDGRGHDRPDVCFAWVTRSLVVDHIKGLLHVQDLDSDGPAARNGVHKAHIVSSSPSWVDGIVAQLESSPVWQAASAGLQPRTSRTEDSLKTTATDVGKTVAGPRTRVYAPDVHTYEDKVRACQEYIAAGDTYELCLTDQTRIVQDVRNGPQRMPSSWSYYRALRTRNPAPFASYIRLGGATLLSSSPERFLRVGPRNSGNDDDDGDDDGDGTLYASMRPMKGTVRRSAAVATLSQAAALLHVPKEEAENLMIVDLVRHDLHGVCGPANVAVRRLLAVEPHGHVFQMVSVVEGRLGAEFKGDANQAARAHVGAAPTALDVLAASLPPGSMTGAPKKRSCERLRVLEQQRERSLYAGVVGYLCVTGRSDWSVTIRSLFRWDDEIEAAPAPNGNGEDDHGRQVWHVGAGGAVTVLSTPEGEREEMLTKLAGPLGIFEDEIASL
ncbi:para-aminobenzoate synthase [Niveomyces insectorum RCEF 264]|uniref:aminodeoxychorismate synthase n=1 Tax=Niveomyces insectorum RCEF 264 TaxID=1081102 RepID=A0A162MU35_9HYPO|nr:para-aminobenzoate synthase [Niveomyces insectorum RCEF 264]